MDPFTVTIPGSRYPIFIPAPGPLHLVTEPQTHNESSKSTASSSSSSQPTSVSKIRRKPMHTYKSPSVSDGFRVDSENIVQRVPPSFSSSSHTFSSNSEKAERSIMNFRRQQPSLSLYHPLGRLAQSLPSIDSRAFGLDNLLSVDDNNVQPDDAESRRASARARRPAAKLRDRDQEDGDDQASVNGAGVANGGAEARPATSPRKRRAAGAAGVGGPKRRRKEVDDGTFPQPPRRTRNPRGAAVASPLAGVAIAATDAGEDGDSPAPVETPDLQTAVLQAQEARPVRSTRSRAPLQRKGSTSSSNTSLSVSIAVHTQQTHVATRVVDAPVQDVEMTDVTSVIKQVVSVEREESEGARVDAKVDVDPDEVQTSAPGASTEVESKEVTVAVPADAPSDPQSLFDQPVLAAQPTAQSGPQETPIPTTTGEASASSMARDVPKPAVEEKEEGELSDGPSR